MAGREVLSAVRRARGGGQDRILLLAAWLRYRAAGAEPAPGRDAQRARRVTGYGRGAAVRGALGHPGDRGEQAPGVGVAWRAEDLLGGRDLDDAAQVHDRDPVAQVPHHGQVVRYQQQREPEVFAQVLQQVEDGGLHADVEGRHRLVGDEDVGAQREGPGDRHPLPLAAGELARVRGQVRLAQPDQREQLRAERRDPVRGHHVVHPQQLAQHPAHGQPRVQRGVRVLEDHLDAAPVRPRPRRREHPAVEADLAAVRAQQPGQSLGERGLARPGFADEGECLAPPHLQVNAVDRAEQALLAVDPGGHPRADRERHGDIAGREQRLSRRDRVHG